MAGSTTGIHISLAVDEAGFSKIIDSAVKPVERLNEAVGKLGDTLDKFDSRSGKITGLKKVAQEFTKVLDEFQKQDALGRRNLENLSRTAGTMNKYVLSVATLADNLKAGKFKNLKDFTGVMSEIGKAFSQLDKIKKPANLVVIQDAVKSISSILDLLQTKIPSSGNIVTRWLKVTFMLKPLTRGIANALNAFSKIQRPENMQHATAGILALERALKLLGQFNFNIIQRIQRGLKFRQLYGVANGVVNTLKRFDKIKNIGNVEKVIPAINALNRLLNSLSGIGKAGQKLASGGIFDLAKGNIIGALTQKGSLLEGFSKFTKVIAKSLGNLGKFDKKQIRSLEAAAAMFNSLISLMRLFAQESDVMIRGGAVMADFADKGVDTAGFKVVINDLIEVAQYISKARFDPNKVLALGSLFDAFNKLGKTPSFGGAGGLGVFSSLSSMASKSINGTISILRNGANTIKNIFSRLFINNPFTDLVRHAQQTVGQISQSMRNFGRELTQTGTQLLATGGVAGFIQSQQVGMVMDFESIMKQIEVLGGVVGDELRNAEQLILDLGESSVFSATEVAAAFLDLSKAGLSVDDISASMEDMLNLAAAGEISVEEASNLVIRAVNSLGLEFSDATMIVDTFVAAANVGTATVASLAQAFGYVANTANTFGQELPQVTAALSLMMDKGIPDERAGTSLDAFFRSMIKPSGPASEAITEVSQALMEMEEQSGALSELGVSFEGDLAGLLTDADGNFRDLNDIIKLITIATEDWTEAERANTLSVMAGSSNAGRALLALLGQYEDGTFAIDEYLTKQEESASAAEVGAALMDTTRGALEELSGAFETLLLKALTPVIEYGIRPMIDGITVLVRLISSLPTPVLAGAAAFIGLSTVLITITGAFMLFSGLVTQLIGFGLVPLTGALWSLANPLKFLALMLSGQGVFMVMGAGLLFIVPLVLTLAGAFNAFKRGVEGLRSGTIEGLVKSFERLWNSIKSLTSAAGQFLDILWQLTSPAPSDEESGLVGHMIAQIRFLVGTVSTAIDQVTDLFNMLSGLSFKNVFGVALEATLPSFGGASSAAADLRSVFADAFSAPLSELGDGVFDRDAAKAWLAMNSFEYTSDLAKLDDLIENMGDVGSVSMPDMLDPGSAKMVTTVTKELRSLDDVLRLLDEDSAAFKTLSDNLDPFADNPIIEFIFGEDATGETLARTLAQVVATVANLRTVGSRTLRTFAEFFDNLRNGVGTVESFKRLIKGIVVDAGMLAAVLLDVTTSVLGLEGFDALIENLAAGNLKGAFIELGKLIIDALIDSAKAALGLAVDVLVWSWNTILKFEDTINWSAVVSTIYFAAEDAWNRVVKPSLAWAWDTVITFYGEIDWGAKWDEIKPTIDDFIVDKVVIPVADLIDIDIDNREEILSKVSSITDAIMSFLDNVVEAASGPGADLVTTTLNNIADALKAITQLDSTVLTAIGLALSLYFAPAIAALALPMLAVVTILTLINGLAAAIPDLVDGLNKLASRDVSGALDSFKSSLERFISESAETLRQIIDFFATIFGFEGVFSQDKYNEAIASWSAVLEALYFVFLDKFAIPIGERIQSLLSFGGLEIGGETIIPEFHATLPGLDSAQTELMRYQLGLLLADATKDPFDILVELGSIDATELSPGAQVALVDTLDEYLAQVFTDPELLDSSSELLNTFLYQLASGEIVLPEGGLINSANLFNQLAGVSTGEIAPADALKLMTGLTEEEISTAVSDSVSNVLSTVAGNSENSNQLMSTLTGKGDDTAITGQDVIDAASIFVESTNAASHITEFSMSATSDIQTVREQIQGLTTDLSTLQAFGWLVEIIPLAGPPGGVAEGTQGPVPEPRAAGGPVFAGKLYEVVEDGMSELLQIGGRTFLIPGQNGTILPASPSMGSGSSLIPNNEYRPSTSNYYGGGESYTDNSNMTLVIEGSSLSMREMEEVAHNVMNKQRTERTRSIRRRLRSKGR